MVLDDAGLRNVEESDTAIVDRYSPESPVRTRIGLLRDLCHHPEALSALSLTFGIDDLREAARSFEVHPVERLAVAVDSVLLNDEPLGRSLNLPDGCLSAIAIERGSLDGNSMEPHYRALPEGRFPRLIHTTVRRLLHEPASEERQAMARWLETLPNLPMARLALALANPQRALGADIVEAAAMQAQANPGIVEALAQLSDQQFPTRATEIAPWSAVASALLGRNFEIDQLVAASPGLALFDDLIDQGFLTVDHVSEMASPGDKTYLLARTCPERLSARDLEELGFTDELDRRAFIESGSQSGVEGSSPWCKVRRDTEAFLSGDSGARERLASTVAEHDLAALEDAFELVTEFAPDLPPERLLERPFVPAATLLHIDAERLLAVPPPDAKQREVAEVALLRAAVQAALSSRWEEADRFARKVLELSTSESARDEALNVLAFTRWSTGSPKDAANALASALKGSYSVNLLANAVRVARDLAPLEAATLMGRLIREAPDTATRVAAAHAILSVWEDNEDEFAAIRGPGESDLPQVVSAPIREVIRADIPLEDFRQIVRVLSLYDSDWLAGENALRDSPHRYTAEARYFTAKSVGLEEGIVTLSAELKSAPASTWLVNERDRLVSLLISAMSGSDLVPGAGIAGLCAIDEQLPMPDRDRVALAALSCQEVALAVAQEEEVGSRLVESRVALMAWAAQSSRDLSGLGDRELDRLTRDCASLVQRTILQGLAGEMRQFIAELLEIPEGALGQALKSVRPMLLGWRQEVTTLYSYIDEDARQATDDFLSDFDVYIT